MDELLNTNTRKRLKLDAYPDLYLELEKDTELEKVGKVGKENEAGKEKKDGKKDDEGMEIEVEHCYFKVIHI